MMAHHIALFLEPLFYLISQLLRDGKLIFIKIESLCFGASFSK